MKRIYLPEPPEASNYGNNTLAFMRALSEWARVTKGNIEQASTVNDTPMDTPFIVSGTFAINTNVNGTMTGTDVSNFICTLIAAMTRKGSVSPTGPQT